MIDELLFWHGPGVGLTQQYNKTFNVVDSAEPGTCYTGESTVQKFHKFLTGKPCTCLFSNPKRVGIMYPN